MTQLAYDLLSLPAALRQTIEAVLDDAEQGGDIPRPLHGVLRDSGASSAGQRSRSRPHSMCTSNSVTSMPRSDCWCGTQTSDSWQHY